MQTLRAAGHNALFAGGCVRDELLGLHPTDYDVATSAAPPQVRRLFSSVHEVGEAFGVMLVTLDSTTVEVATFRTDGRYTDNRRPDAVTFTDDRADAARRDFTVNALFLDPLADAGPARSPLGGRIIDYVGGLADLEARIIRAVGDADARLDEDHLRALRAVRFAARLGFRIDPATADAVRAHASQLKGVSRERIGEELRRMLTHPARAGAAGLLQSLTLDAPALNGPSVQTPTVTLAALPGSAPYTTALAAWLIDRHGLGALTGPGSAPALRAKGGGAGLAQTILSQVRNALCLTNMERDEVADLLTCLGDLMGKWFERSVAGRKRWASRPGFVHALSCLAPHHPEAAARAGEMVRQLQGDGIGLHPPLLVDGDDLIGLGFKPGPVFKALLDRLYDEQLEGRLKTKGEGLELAKVWGV
ncbi:MAG: hypothetical protein K2Q09_12130 [Phycisphaerales bacterium]|nr:hypothetical protein [Phycisphaerales bacterium]